jgi:hypothetical protein
MSQRKGVTGKSVPNRLYYPMRLHDLSIPQSNPIKRKTMQQVTTGFLATVCFFILNIPDPEAWKIIFAIVGSVVMVIANSGSKLIEVYGKWMDRRHQNRMNKLTEKEQSIKNERIERNGYDIEDHLGA